MVCFLIRFDRLERKSILAKPYKFGHWSILYYDSIHRHTKPTDLPRNVRTAVSNSSSIRKVYRATANANAPQDSTRLAEKLAQEAYDDKCKNDPVWQGYNRAYKAHYARLYEKKMTVSEFEQWRAGIQWRTKAQRMMKFLMGNICWRLRNSTKVTVWLIPSPSVRPHQRLCFLCAEGCYPYLPLYTPTLSASRLISGLGGCQ
jgi:hypothetical protein